jgi:hypothetical protein
MLRNTTARYLAFILLSAPLLATAEIGVTDGCQKEIAEVEEDIRRHDDQYTLESKTRARAELAAARTNRLNAIKCRGNIQDARKALREGKRERKENTKAHKNKD